ncbi:MAG: CoA-transferase [Spirochaetes bacterium]|nr:CoA-transferase [Spirochaetota bacterium]MBU1081580.1 CoA-transferase [Spirochaetota bacterium]
MSAWTASDIMALCLARLLRTGETVFHGVASPLPLVAILAAKRLSPPGPVYLNITGGVDASPRRLPKSTDDPELLAGSASLFGLADIFDLAARGGLDTAFIGAAQIDGSCRLNSSVIGPFDRPKVRLPGGAGSAVLVPNAKRTLVWRTKHDPRSFPARVDFVTSMGGIDRVVTPLCVFRNAGGRLVLESIHPGVGFDEVAAATGFPLAAISAPATPAPSAAEMAALAAVDPGRLRDIEFA